MSRTQKLIAKIFPHSWAESMEAESRDWMVKCTCGYERSVWDIGGVRWKASGRSKQRQPCPSCGQITWHIIYYKKQK